MITIQKKPYLCAFSKNSIDFTVSTDLQYQTAVIKPSLVLEFQEKPTTGTTYEIKFTNPKTWRTEKVNLVAVDGSSASNYANKWQIPDDSFSGTLAELRTIVFGKLCEFAVFNAWYKIELPIFELPGATPRITITANQAIEELVIIWASNQPTALIDKYISEANSVAYYQPGVRDGYALNASLFLEKNYNSGIFELITTIDCALDENSVAHVDVSKYIDAEIEASWPEYPIPMTRELGYKADNLRKYYLEFSETFTNSADVNSIKTEVFYAHWGGASFDDAYNGDTISNLLNSGKWLTWWPSGKRILREQNDWLAWMNGAEKKYVRIIGKCTLAISSDGENLNVDIDKILCDNLLINSFESYIFNVGFDINFKEEIELFLSENPTISNASIIQSTFYLSQSNDTLNFLCHFIDGSSSANTEWHINSYHNGRRQWGDLAINGLTIQYNDRWELYYNHFGAPAILIGFLNTNDEIPIGEFTIIENEYFLSAEILNLVIYDSDKVNFRYFPLDNCLAKQILYFNSFGVPESFLVSGEFQQNMTTSQELATRSQYFALSNLLPQQYVFDSAAGISYQTETMMLTNEEANRLMPLLNSTITFLKEGKRFIPVILNAGTNAIYKVNSFLQTIKLDLFQANETDRISYFDVLPEIEPLIFGNGIEIVTLKRNLLNITDFGSIVVTQNGAQLGIFTYNSTQKYYSGTAIFDEGLLTFTLTCHVDNAEVIVSKTINYQWQMKVFETFIIGGGAFSIFAQGLYSSKPIRIDWGDGTVEDETLTNSLLEYSHTYAVNGKKIIRVFKPSFFDVQSLLLYNIANYADVTDMTYLTDLRFNSCMTSGYYLQGLDRLQNLKFDNTNVLTLNIGFQKSIATITLNTTNISEDAFEDFIKEVWLFRKAYENGFDIEITSEVVISDVASTIINGTGIYAGDGLNTYGISIVNI